jgi:hypothetical protein
MGSLLHLEDGKVSLEFASAKLPDVRKLITRNWGNPDIVQHVDHVRITIAGHEFIYQNEWDDPCLISVTLAGSQLLEQLHSQLQSK